MTTRPGEDEARTWSDIGRDFPEVTRIEIADQNRGFFDSGWTWMDDSDLAHVQEARDRMEAAGAIKQSDASDSGMLYCALTGDQKQQQPPASPASSPPPRCTGQRRCRRLSPLAQERVELELPTEFQPLNRMQHGKQIDERRVVPVEDPQ